MNRKFIELNAGETEDLIHETITRLTNAQAYVKTDDSGDVFRVYKANLRLVEKQD